MSIFLQFSFFQVLLEDRHVNRLQVHFKILYLTKKLTCVELCIFWNGSCAIPLQRCIVFTKKIIPYVLSCIVLGCTQLYFTGSFGLICRTKVRYTKYLNSLAIRLRSEDLHHLILSNGIPKLQGQHISILLRLCNRKHLWSLIKHHISNCSSLL